MTKKKEHLARVHAMCLYLRGRPCQQCPSSEMTPYGSGQRGCFAVAEETIAVADRAADEPAPQASNSRLAELKQLHAEIVECDGGRESGQMELTRWAIEEIERLQRELERLRAAPDAADIEQLASYYEHGADVDTEIAGELAQRDARLLGKALRALQRERTADEPSAGVKCTHCNGNGYNEPIYDEQDGWTDETPCETCDGSGRITTVEQYLKTLPANWHEDSSLETWFPITAEELKRLKDARATVPPSAALHEWKEDEWAFPVRFLQAVKKAAPPDMFAPSLEGIECALLGYERATGIRLDDSARVENMPTVSENAGQS